MKKLSIKALVTLIILIFAGAYYYVTIPAINIHSSGFWTFAITALIIINFIIAFAKLRDIKQLKESKLLKIAISFTLVVIIVLIIGTVLSSPIVNSSKYQKLLTVEEREFATDIKEVSYQSIPILDKDSATLLGNRKMGSMTDYVSQFEVSNLYTQINYQGNPVRVSPLVYASPIKWLTNQKNGIPAYIRINMTTQEVECVKLTSGIKYSQSEYFNRNIYRHLRFNYPTYIFDSINFETDEEGIPYWICPVKTYRIGLFGGEDIDKAVLCNAITGECKEYDIEEIPEWIDRVYSAELLIKQYDYYGTLKHGYFNTLLSQRDCLETTDGYNYLAFDDDVWVYTGITSVSGDESNVGFVLMNQRTKETRYYSVEGAEEYSAMSSAEGQVQNLGYKATFPLLLNIGGEPTYFICLKDAAGLVKKYAFVNVRRYQIVAIGDTVAECEKQYISLMASNGISSVNSESIKKASGIIKKIAQSVIDGNSHYYIMLENNDNIFEIKASDDINIIRYGEGDRISFEYAEGAEVNTIMKIN